MLSTSVKFLPNYFNLPVKNIVHYHGVEKKSSHKQPCFTKLLFPLSCCIEHGFVFPEGEDRETTSTCTSTMLQGS